MKRQLLIFCGICLFSLAVRAEPNPQSVLLNREGMNAMKNNSPTQAQEKFIQGLSSSPFEAKLHLNLGLTFGVLGQAEKAQSSYETALQFSEDDETKFVANFNLGEMQQKAKNKTEALRYYQQALKYNPDSLETKVNIELLTKDGQGGGQGDQQNKDQQNQDGKGQGDQQSDSEQKQDEKDGQGQENQKKQISRGKPQPQKFKSEELTQGDVNKILGEIKQQEQKIRSDFNKREVKEQPNDQDW